MMMKKKKIFINARFPRIVVKVYNIIYIVLRIVFVYVSGKHPFAGMLQIGPCASVCMFLPFHSRWFECPHGDQIHDDIIYIFYSIE